VPGDAEHREKRIVFGIFTGTLSGRTFVDPGAEPPGIVDFFHVSQFLFHGLVVCRVDVIEPDKAGAILCWVTEIFYEIIPVRIGLVLSVYADLFRVWFYEVRK